MNRWKDKFNLDISEPILFLLWYKNSYFVYSYIF